LEIVEAYPAWARKKMDIEPPPAEFTELVLCRDVYHCLPSELEQEDWRVISGHIEMIRVENEVNDNKAKK
jgi:hypothetical protein